MDPSERRTRSTKAARQQIPAEGGTPARAGERDPGSAHPAGRDRPPRTADGTPRPRAIRLHVARADLWSVMTTSFLVLTGFGLCVLVATTVLWITIGAVDRDLPPLGWGVALTTAVVVLETVFGTALATLAAFLYNVSARYAGGVRLTLDDDVAEVDLPVPVIPRDTERLLARLRARPGCSGTDDSGTRSPT